MKLLKTFPCDGAIICTTSWTMTNSPSNFGISKSSELSVSRPAVDIDAFMRIMVLELRGSLNPIHPVPLGSPFLKNLQPYCCFLEMFMAILFIKCCIFTSLELPLEDIDISNQSTGMSNISIVRNMLLLASFFCEKINRNVVSSMHSCCCLKFG